MNKRKEHPQWKKTAVLLPSFQQEAKQWRLPGCFPLKRAAGGRDENAPSSLALSNTRMGAETQAEQVIYGPVLPPSCVSPSRGAMPVWMCTAPTAALPRCGIVALSEAGEGSELNSPISERHEVMSHSWLHDPNLIFV